MLKKIRYDVSSFDFAVPCGEQNQDDVISSDMCGCRSPRVNINLISFDVCGVGQNHV